VTACAFAEPLYAISTFEPSGLRRATFDTAVLTVEAIDDQAAAGAATAVARPLVLVDREGALGHRLRPVPGVVDDAHHVLALRPGPGEWDQVIPRNH
jgi:hypothetical protein